MSDSRMCLRRAVSAGLLIGLLSVGGLLAAAHHLGRKLEQARARPLHRAELTYFPTGPGIRAATLGRARLAADFCWLEAIQYYGKHHLSDRRYDYAETIFRTVTDLDPRFENAYVFGALVLHGDCRAPEAAFALLAKGMEANPASWRLAFERGFLAYLTAKDSPEAVRYLSRAARLPGAPAWAGRLAASAAEKSGERDLSLEMWQRVLENSENAEVRRMAEEKLRELEAPAGLPGRPVERIDRPDAPASPVENHE